jgi:hypothetical protein
MLGDDKDLSLSFTEVLSVDFDEVLMQNLKKGNTGYRPLPSCGAK